MALPPIKPPAEPPLTPDGQHSTAWTAHFQAVTDQLAALTGQIAALSKGVTDGSSAAAGEIGEYLTAAAGPIGLSNGVAADVVTLPLGAGDFDVWGNVHFAAAGTTHPTECVAGIGSTAATFGTAYEQIGAPFNVGANVALGVGGPVRFTSAGAQTAHLVARAAFTVSTLTVSGMIWARRIH